VPGTQREIHLPFREFRVRLYHPLEVGVVAGIALTLLGLHPWRSPMGAWSCRARRQGARVAGVLVLEEALTAGRDGDPPVGRVV